MLKLNLSRFLLFPVFILLFSCSDDSGPGYQEPYTPDPTDDLSGDDGPAEETLTDNELLDLVQKETFKYFWDFAESNSGMARERSQDDAYGGQAPQIVTTGGTGFGLASFPIAVERGWISRDEATDRLVKILDFLDAVPKYHGAFSHWYMGNSAETRPFSDLDDGGDLVETAFLLQGLLICRQYFDSDSEKENEINARITEIWEGVEWTWYTQGQNVLYWHWSPNNQFAINLQIKGWNESLIVYVLAAASPTYPISKEVYTEGWASNGGIVTSRSHYGINMPMGPNYGGPLFFSHYSFIGLDPRKLEDQYAQYWEQNEAHSLINYNYCIDNPKNFEGYGENSWGLTASDSKDGYAAHSPTNDLGVITPTAALSSFPYTPEESMAALRYFYEEQGDDLWGEMGFYDAFSEEYNWYADGYLAIDQGPIIAMIENHRTQLLWNLFMADEDVKSGLDKLDFSY
ncbi:glucoamylase family protein [Christiangramia sp. SM2212]|uniref:Glucoamylase family protein n=1 Tax=Christiangramia sediminicola TaxID=3073267 RepID=A0ABU1EMC0_9FLAO|nr:glucoamylase family protein [Christiangramia sp. SM2212]MDR5589537.1 glucoamylase family protein [Christiangramia sp. SM2212]